MWNFTGRWCADESGATSIEYALIAAFIGLVLIIAVPGVGLELISIFTDVENGFKTR